MENSCVKNGVFRERVRRNEGTRAPRENVIFAADIAFSLRKNLSIRIRRFLVRRSVEFYKSAVFAFPREIYPHSRKARSQADFFEIQPSTAARDRTTISFAYKNVDSGALLSITSERTTASEAQSVYPMTATKFFLRILPIARETRIVPL